MLFGSLNCNANSLQRAFITFTYVCFLLCNRFHFHFHAQRNQSPQLCLHCYLIPFPLTLPLIEPNSTNLADVSTGLGLYVCEFILSCWESWDHYVV